MRKSRLGVLATALTAAAWAHPARASEPPAPQPGTPGPTRVQPPLIAQAPLDPTLAPAEGLRSPGRGRFGRGRSRGRQRVIGFLADAGLPDGAIAALAIRPVSWLRLHGGAGTNTISAGVRGGATLLLPALISPSLSFEVGHYPSGPSNEFVRRILGIDSSLGDLFERLGYTYFNGHLGLEVGSRTFAFFLHGGMSYARATLENAAAALEARANDETRGAANDRMSVRVNGNPKVRVLTPSVKLGFVFYVR